MAERIDLEHDQGATFYRRFIWKTDETNPVEVDVTDYTARMHVRSTIDATETALELTTENGRITLGTTDGVVDLLVNAATMETVPAASYRYDLEMVSPAGHVTRLAEGKLKIRPEVTR